MGITSVDCLSIKLYYLSQRILQLHTYALTHIHIDAQRHRQTHTDIHTHSQSISQLSISPISHSLSHYGSLPMGLIPRFRLGANSDVTVTGERLNLIWFLMFLAGIARWYCSWNCLVLWQWWPVCRIPTSIQTLRFKYGFATTTACI